MEVQVSLAVLHCQAPGTSVKYQVQASVSGTSAKIQHQLLFRFYPLLDVTPP